MVLLIDCAMEWKLLAKQESQSPGQVTSQLKDVSQARCPTRWGAVLYPFPHLFRDIAHRMPKNVRGASYANDLVLRWCRQYITYLPHLRPYPMRSLGHGQHSASTAHPTLGCLLQLLPALTVCLLWVWVFFFFFFFVCFVLFFFVIHFCLGVSAPCVPGSSLSLPLWIPGQSQ